MSDPSSSSSFRSLLDAALQDYANQTGTNLDDHPLAKELQLCDDVDSMSAILEKQAQRFHEFGEDGKIMRSLKSVVHVLYDLSVRAALQVGDGTGMVCPKALTLPMFRFVSYVYSVAVDTCEGSICCFRRLARRRSPSPFPHI
jgi:hypothetical protein